MEMNLKQLSTQKTDATTGSVKMRLSENATSMVFQLFTKNIYSNPKGTVVREITSNCFDSHVEAKVNAPVRIKKWFNGQDNSHYISFIDYGMGMSPDRVNNIYGVYFESTKRTTNEQIGGFGIGGKTPLAYKRKTGHGEGEYDNQFYVVTVFDGTKYFYCITEGEECPEITLLHSEATTDHNGTEVRVPILEKDIPDFEKEMIRQLYYFENIIFEGFENSNVTNDYKIIQGKTFLYRGDDYEGEMHVCLGRVAYPINYNVLNLNYNDYRIPIAIKLEVGEINVIASREQLDYNENTIKVLKRKMEEAKAEIKAMLTKQYDSIVTLEQYFQAKNNFGTLYFSNGMSMNTGKMIVFKDLDLTNFKYSFLKMPNDKQLFKFFFNVRTLGKKTTSRRNRYNSDTTFEGGYDEVQGREDLFYYEGEELNRKIVKQAYLKSEYGTYYMINKRNIHLRSDIVDLFNVHLDSTIDKNGKPVKFVKGLLNMQEEYFNIVCKFVKNYDKIEVPADYIAERKNRHQIASKEMRAIKISLKFGGNYKYSGIPLGMLFDYDMPIFYGTQEDEYRLRNAERMYDVLFDDKAAVSSYSDYNNRFSNGYNSDGKNKKSIMFIALAKNNIKYMLYCKNAKPVSEFFTGMLKRREDKVKNYFHTYDIVKEWENVGTMFRSKSFSELNAVWGSKIDNVRTFIKAVKGDDNLGNMKSELSRYFDLSKQKETAAQKIIRLQIDEIKKLEEQNRDILRYISLPYNWDSSVSVSEHPVLINILQKVMVF